MPKALPAAAPGPGQAMGTPRPSTAAATWGKLGKVCLRGPSSLLRVREEAGRATLLRFRQQPCPLKHQRGQVSIETPPKHKHSPFPGPGTALRSPLCLGKGCVALGLLPGEGKPAAPAPAALPAA